MKPFLRLALALVTALFLHLSCENPSSPPAATAPAITYTLTTTVNHGTVTRSPSLAQYNPGTLVTLTATPDEGYAFTGWTGDATGSANPISITVTQNTVVQANFTAKYTVTATAGSNGTVGKSPDKADYLSGTSVTLTAAPSVGYAFAGWTGDVTGTTNPITITVTKNTVVQATFSPSTARYTLTATAASHGTVVRSPDQADYLSGTNVTVTATPDAGYAFSGWTGDATGTTNPLTINLSKNTSVQATFTPVYTVVATPVAHGSVTRSPDQAEYLSGSTVTLTATPDAGYAFTGWTGDATGTVNPKTLTVTKNTVVQAGFVATHTLTLNSTGASPVLTASPSGSVFTEGTSVTLTAPEVSGYVFDGWKENGAFVGTVPQAKSYTLTMDTDRTLTAQYTANKTTILVYLDGDNSLESEAIADFNEMEAADLRGTGITLAIIIDRIAGIDTSNGNWTDTRAYRVTYGGSAVPDGTITSSRVALPALGITTTSTVELNMGSTATLAAFTAWGKATYPAAQNLLVFWNHGGGWRKAVPVPDASLTKSMSAPVATAITIPGRSVPTTSTVTKLLCTDDTTGAGGYLYTRDLGTTLGNGSFDVIGFDLCLGGMVEVAYELKDKASYMIASEELTPGDGWEYNLWLESFAAKAGRTNLDLVNSVVDAFQTRYTGVAGTTLAGYDLAKVPDLMTKLNAYAGAVSAAIVNKATQTAVWNILLGSVEQIYNGSPGDYNLDLGDMAKKCAAAGLAAPQATALNTALQAVVVKEWHDLTNVQSVENIDATGMSIYLCGTDSSANTGHEYAYFADHATLAPTVLKVPSFVDAPGNLWVPNYGAGTGLLYDLFYKVFP